MIGSVMTGIVIACLANSWWSFLLALSAMAIAYVLDFVNDKVEPRVCCPHAYPQVHGRSGCYEVGCGCKKAG